MGGSLDGGGGDGVGCRRGVLGWVHGLVRYGAGWWWWLGSWAMECLLDCYFGDGGIVRMWVVFEGSGLFVAYRWVSAG